MHINKVNSVTDFRGFYMDNDARKRMPEMSPEDTIRYARAARDLKYTQKWDLYRIDDKFEIRDRKTGTSLMNKLEPCYEDGVAFIRTEGHCFGNKSSSDRIDIAFKKLILPNVSKKQIQNIKKMNEIDKNVALIQLLEFNSRAHSADYCGEI